MFSVHALKSHMDSLCQPKQYEEIETDAVKLNPRDGHMQQHPPFVKTRQRKVVLIENYTSRNGGRAVMCAVGSMIWWERVVGAGQIYSNWKFNAINCVRKRFLYFSHSIVVANAATNPQTTENSLLCTWIIFLFGFVDDDSIRLLCACFLCSCSQFILHPPLTAAIVWIGEINYWFRRSELRTRCSSSHGDDLRMVCKSHGSPVNFHWSFPFARRFGDEVCNFRLFFCSILLYPIPLIQFVRCKSHEQITINYMI